MLFNSCTLFLFFAVVYTAYLLLARRRQNRLLLVASYLIYGWWDWRFLSLIVISTIVDFACGAAIDRSGHARSRRLWLTVSIATNLGILGLFKYFKFFAESLQILLGLSVGRVIRA